jgi:hypothetical protein
MISNERTSRVDSLAWIIERSERALPIIMPAVAKPMPAARNQVLREERESMRISVPLEIFTTGDQVATGFKSRGGSVISDETVSGEDGMIFFTSGTNLYPCFGTVDEFVVGAIIPEHLAKSRNSYGDVALFDESIASPNSVDESIFSRR